MHHCNGQVRLIFSRFEQIELNYSTCIYIKVEPYENDFDDDDDEDDDDERL